MSGNYNDYIDRFDTKDFEKLAREYTKKYQNDGSIMGLNNAQNEIKNEHNFALKEAQNTEQFFANFESLIKALMQFDFDSIYTKKYSNFTSKNIKKDTEINALTKSLCRAYFELKGEPYFCSLKGYKSGQNNAKNLRIKGTSKCPENSGEDTIFDRSNYIDNTYKNCDTNKQNFDNKNLAILALTKNTLWGLINLQNLPQDMSKNILPNTPEILPQNILENLPQNMTINASQNARKNMPENMFQNAPQKTLRNASENASCNALTKRQLFDDLINLLGCAYKGYFD